MLVLSRKANEQIVLPELGIVIEVVSVKGKAVRIGIDAPRDIRVLRGEIVGTPRPESAQQNQSQPAQKARAERVAADVKNSAIIRTTGLKSRVSKMREAKQPASRTISYQPDSANDTMPVRETASTYNMLRTPVELVFEQTEESVAC